ncbi:MAG: hypothetical protein H6Q00_2417 [Holophagaceae bacterium]|nr:hypothetical protein [Holophagaceae bacterium]
MSNRVQIITHKGKKIVFVDNSNLTPAEIIANFPIFSKLAIDNKIRLVCMDVTNTTTDDNIKKAGAETHAKMTAALGHTCSAIVGIRGIQKILANAMQKGQCFAETKEQALDWLVEQPL